MTDTQDVLQTLRQVMDPELDRSIVDLGMVHDIKYEDAKVNFTLALTTIACPMKEQMADDARKRLLALDGVDEVDIDMREMTDQEKEKLAGRPKQESGMAVEYNNIKHVVAVLSGKGGVGKSTVAALLAILLRRQGHTVGVLDADITGPSIPKMLLHDSKHPIGGPQGILPVESDSGIKVISINLLLADPNQAVIWRGPLIGKALKQFWGDVAWGELDYLVVDLPPGTSDASLTVMQSMPLNGVVLVTTPQDLAGMVVRKASSMANQLDIPILGVVENMSYIECPNCGEKIELFGASKASDVIAQARAPLLGRMPIHPEISNLADRGRLEEYEAEEFEAVVKELLKVMPETAHTPMAQQRARQ